MISQTAEYALRATVFLAREPGKASTSRTISESTGVPQTYLSKILRQLTRAGVIDSARGPRGGFTLAGSPERFTALDVVSVVEPLARPGCPLGLAEHEGRLCPLHARLARITAVTEEALRGCTLLDLLGPPESTEPGCPFPTEASLEPRRFPDKEETG